MISTVQQSALSKYGLLEKGIDAWNVGNLSSPVSGMSMYAGCGTADGAPFGHVSGVWWSEQNIMLGSAQCTATSGRL